MKVTAPSIPLQKKKIQRHAVLMQRKVTAILAFTTTIFLLCVENVKAFTAPLASPDALFMLATGAHSVAKRWKPSEGKNSGFFTNAIAFSKSQSAFTPSSTTQTQRKSLTSLRMAFGFGLPLPSTPAPQMLDMKTSINAFGSWYNDMDPVARPPIYDDEVTDYSFSSPADNWPSSFEDDAVMSSVPNSFVASAAEKKLRRPRPIHTIRKIAGWVFGSPAVRNARGFGTQNFL
mmetsp:Transcript_2385/g.3669  ORF Transcript_2385/g.3669 Transcript_2385/m.3669 type:complete len:232 (+) Transcript_2385:66-761(+)